MAKELQEKQLERLRNDMCTRVGVAMSMNDKFA